MKRKTTQTPSRIWSFGALAPTAGADLVGEQLRLASRYYNRLVEIELQRRREYREARARCCPGLERLEQEAERWAAELATVNEAIKQIRASDRACTESEALRLAKDAARRGLAEARASLKEARQVAKASEELASESEQIQQRSYQAVRDARAECGVYWGTYLLVEKAADAMRRSKMDPRFRRFDGAGRIGVHLSHGRSVTELLSCEDTCLRLREVHAGGRGGRRRQFVCRIRVGSNGRAPLFADFPVLMHRTPPADARIKAAWILVTKRGPRSIYSLQIALESEMFVPTRCGDGVVAIDVGWRDLWIVGELRVGYWLDDSGKRGEIRLSSRDLLAFGIGSPAETSSSPDAIRSVSDRHFEHARGHLHAWLSETRDAPCWLVEACQHLSQWRAQRKLVRVARLMREHAMSGVDFSGLWASWKSEQLAIGKDLFAPLAEIREWLDRRGVTDELSALTVYLDWWRQKSTHLYAWECDARARAVARRRNLYRCLAAQFAGRYRTIVLEDLNLAELALKRTAGEALPASRNRAVAACGELRGALCHAFGEARVERFPAEWTTKRCHVCGIIDRKLDAQRHVHVRCSNPKCRDFDVPVDQDLRACHNLLHAWRERFGGAKDTGTARTASKQLQSDAERLAG